jgi:hypothetical protein
VGEAGTGAAAIGPGAGAGEPLPEPAAALPGPPAAAPAPEHCANCDAPLSGPYCSACGQRHHHRPVHHFGHFVSEALEDVTHADSRLWRTLGALLFRPGLLTVKFLEGRRVHYLPPVRLYLVVSVIFFIIAGIASRLSPVVHVIARHDGKSSAYLTVPAPRPRGPAALARTPGRIAGGLARGLATGGSTPAARQRLCAMTGSAVAKYGGWLSRLSRRATRSCLVAHAAGGLARLNEAVQHNLERAMFLFLPLLALVMKPLYLKPPRHYVEHLLFFLHNHAFLFVVLAAATVLKMITSSAVVLDPIDTALTIYVPVYFYRAMRRVYGQGRWLTLSKLAALAVAYSFLGMLMFVATVSYSFLTL